VPSATMARSRRQVRCFGHVYDEGRTYEVSATGQDAPFGAHLRRLRGAAGLTQEELAERAGLTAKGISDLERGRRRPYPHTVRSLADALGLSEEERGSLFAAVPKRGDAGPATSSAVAEPTLPSPPTMLVGRDRGLAEVRDLLRRREVRLLTLTGTGGVGKTRLALEAARASANLFPDGVVFVALAPLNDPALVIPTVARSLGLRESEGQTPREVLHAYLHEKRLLLLLDNFERLLEAASEVAGMIELCPDLVVLVTSRAPLRVRASKSTPCRPSSCPAISSRRTRKRLPTRSPAAYSWIAPGRPPLPSSLLGKTPLLWRRSAGGSPDFHLPWSWRRLGRGSWIRRRSLTSSTKRCRPVGHEIFPSGSRP
jgi:transcriptional regulator with XRE-family HTH domain